MYKVLSIILFVLIACACVNTPKNPNVTPLRISNNHRYFTNADGDPVFWLGDTGWLLFSKLKREEVAEYLDTRANQGFNVIQIMVLHTLKACNVYGDSALVNQNVAHPLLTDGNNPADSLQYDYWDNVEFVIDEAAKRHIHIGLVPVWGNNVKDGKVSRADAAVYAEFLANRFKSKPNVVWLVGGDVRGSDSIATWDIIGEKIKTIDSLHLITYHPRGRNSSSRWFQHEKWLDFNMCQSGHRTYDQDNDSTGMMFGEDNWRFIQADLALTPLRPALDGEPSYEEIPHGLHDTLQPRWQDYDLRRYAYWSVFAGAAGFTYGHNSVMQFHRPIDKEGAYGAKTYWQPALVAPGAKQMQYLKNLMLSRPYFDRVAAPELVMEQGESYDYVASTKGNGYALLYTFSGRDIKVDLPKLGFSQATASWFDPRTGQTNTLGDFKTDEPLVFNTPGEPQVGNDWVLILDEKE